VSGRHTIVVLSAVIALAAACELAAGATLPAAAGDGAAGAALLGGGVVAMGVPRGARSGALMIGCAMAWFAGTVWAALAFVHRGPLVQLVLAYPRLRPGSRIAAAVVAMAYVCAVVTVLARSGAVMIVLAVAMMAAAVVRWHAAAGAERRARTAALAATAVIAAAFAVVAAARLDGGHLDSFALWSYDVAVAVTAGGLAADLRWGRWTRAAVAELIGDLGTLGGAAMLRDRLAGALDDPDLAIGFTTADGSGYIDQAGGPLPLPAGQEGQVVTYVDEDGRHVAVLVHGPGLLDDGRVLAGATAAVRLAASKVRLQDELRATVAEVAASRRRLVEAGIEQRRRLEAELRDGAERRLAVVADRLARAAGAPEVAGDGSLAGVAAGVEQARQDLYRFAQGIHPAALGERGLAAALTEAAGRMPLAVAVDAPPERFAPDLEATIYFLCMEALANVGKHAGATHVRIDVRRGRDRVEVAIADDGHGGADPALGSGLRALTDRIHALGGRLEVDSPVGGGTRLEAVFGV
jgi:signal transduction histidine kinase